MSNRLVNEKSPYLLQHQNNPVDWFSWGEEAFEKARRENKPIFLSVGYSTCHWCHVMEHDSFEIQEVADVLNKFFISIKVDREERPDVDALYMEAVQSMTGRGGWPMSVFLTKELKPFFGGTFFWKDQFIALLNQIHQVWSQDPLKLHGAAEELTQYLSAKIVKAASVLSPQVMESAFEMYQQSFDKYFGGFGAAPKFPRSTDLSFLLRYYHRTQKPEALQMATVTLDKMARGGMYDHLAGGFHRYSTDARWLVPHFEKMLYDNALLAWTYCEAYQVTKKEMYASVAREICDYVLSDMTSPLGGFYSAEDADSEGVEGKYYVWTLAELDSLLTKEEFEKISSVYGISDAGNFHEGGLGLNILNLQNDYDWSVKNDPLIKSAHEKLLAVRKKRIPPLKDDKVLTAWNGLMIFAMAKAYQVLGDKRYLESAQKAASFIKKYLYQNQTLLRRYREGEARFAGVLEDYAYLIQGVLELYQSDSDSAWHEWAIALQQKQEELFADPAGGYFTTSLAAHDIIVRKKDAYDGATPSGNSIAALNLLKFYSLSGEKNYFDNYEKLESFISADVNRYPPGHSQFLIANDFKTALTVCEGDVCIVPGSGLPQWSSLFKTA